jgi:hypothetical protein
MIKNRPKCWPIQILPEQIFAVEKVAQNLAYFFSFSQKNSIAEISDHNIDPRSQSFKCELQRQRCKNLQGNE